MRQNSPLTIGIDVASLSDRSWTGIPLYVESLLGELLSDRRAGEIREEFTLVGSRKDDDVKRILRERGISGASLDAAKVVPAVELRLAERFEHKSRQESGSTSKGVASTMAGRVTSSFIRKWDGRIAIPAGRLATTQKLMPRLDLFHHTSILRVLAAGARRHVVTIFDLTTRFYPETHNRVNIAEWERVFAFARDRADRVITDSESARQDVIEHLGIPAERVTAIPLGMRRLPSVSAEDCRAVRDRFALAGCRIVLVVGSLEPRKNLPRMIEAFSQLVRVPGMETVLLVLVGAQMHGATAVDSAISRFELAANVRRTGYVTDKDLAALLKICDVFAYPSLYEGFGLPALEAMALGAPVITSNRSSLPEVVGDAALQVDPESTQALADGMIRLLSDHEFAEDLRQRGSVRAARFTWKRTAEEHLRVYHEVCAS